MLSLKREREREREREALRPALPSPLCFIYYYVILYVEKGLLT
jgi:hypothetical protein